MIFQNNNNKSMIDKIKAGEKNFSGTNLSGLNLKNMDLSGCDFTDADLSKVVFRKANLEGAVFKNAFMEGVSLVKASAKKCNFSGAVLHKADMMSGIFTGCDFTDANMEKAILDSASFNGSVLKNAKLTKSILNEVSFLKSDMNGCVLKNSDGMDSNFSEANLTGADLSGAVLAYVNFTKVNFKDAVLNMAEFNFSDFTAAALDEAKVEGSNLKKVYGLTEELEENLKARGALISGHYVKKIMRFLWQNKIARTLSFIVIMATISVVYLYFNNPHNRGSLYLMRKADQLQSVGDIKEAIKIYEIVASRRDIYNKFVSYSSMANISYGAGETKEAIEYLKKGLKLSEDNLLDVNIVIDVETKLIGYFSGLYGKQYALDYINERKSFYKGEDIIIKTLLLNEADIYYSQKKYDKANEIYLTFEKVLISDNYINAVNFMIVNFKKAVIALEEGDKDKANEYFMEYLRDIADRKNAVFLESLDNFQSFTEVIDFYLNNPQYDKGLARLQKVFMAMNPDKRSELYFLILDYYLQSNNITFMGKVLAILDIDYSLNPEFYYFKAILANYNNEEQDVRKFFEKALTTEKTASVMPILFRYIDFLTVEKKYEKAVGILKDHLHIKAHYADIVLMIVNIFKLQEDYEEAVNWLEKIKKYSYYAGNYYAEMYKIKLLQNESDEAFSMFTEAVAHEKVDGNIWNLWNDFFNEPQFTEKFEIVFLEQQFVRYKDNPVLIFLLFRNIIDKAYNKVSSEEMNKLINTYASVYKDQYPYDFFMLQAKIDLAKKDYQKAFVSYKKAFEYFENTDLSVYFNIDVLGFVTVCRKLGRLPEAVSYLEEVLAAVKYREKTYFLANVNATLFSLSLELGKTKKAEEILSMFEGEVQSIALYTEAARFEQENKNWDKMFQYYELSLNNVHPDELYNVLNAMLQAFIVSDLNYDMESFLLGFKEKHKNSRDMIKADINLVLAKFYIFSKKTAEAEVFLGKLDLDELNQEKEVSVHMLRAMLARQNGKLEQEFEIYHKLLFNSGMSQHVVGEVLNMALENYTHQGKSSGQKLEFLDQCIDFYKDNRMFLIIFWGRKVNLLKENRRYAEADIIYEDIIRNYNFYYDKFNIYMEYAASQIEQKKYERALDIYDEVFELLNEYDLINYMASVSTMFADTGRYSDWENFLMKIKDKFGYLSYLDDVLAFYHAKIFIKKGKVDKALSELTKINESSIELFDYAAAYMDIVGALVKADRFAEAEENAVKVLSYEREASTDRLFWMIHHIVSVYRNSVNYMRPLESLFNKVLLAYDDDLRLKQIIWLALVDLYKDVDIEKAEIYINELKKTELSEMMQIEFKFAEGLFLEKKHDYAAAIDIYQEILDRGDSVYAQRAFEMLLSVYRTANMQKEIKEFFKKYKKTDGGELSQFDYMVFLSSIRSDISLDVDKAEKSVYEFLEKHPDRDNFEMYIELANIYRIKRDFDKAVGMYNTALLKNTDTSRIAYVVNEIVSVFYESERTEKVMPFVDESLVKYQDIPDVIKACRYAIVRYYINIEPEKALTELKALELMYVESKEDLPAYILLDKMQIYINLLEVQKAFAILDDIEQAFGPGNNMFLEACQSLMSTLGHKKQYDILEKFLQEGLEKYKDVARLSFLFEEQMSQFYRQRGNVEKAQQLKEQLVAKYSDVFVGNKTALIDYKSDLAVMKIESGRHDEAYDIYRECLENIDSSFNDEYIKGIISNYINVCQQLKFYDEIDSVIDEMMQKYQGRIRIESTLLLEKARTKRARGNFDESISLYLNYLETYQDEQHFNISCELADVYSQMGAKDEASAILNDILRSDKKLPEDIIVSSLNNLFNLTRDASDKDSLQELSFFLLDKNKDNISLYQNILIAFIHDKVARSDFEEAAEILAVRKDVVKGHESYSFYHMMATLNMSLMDYAKARDFYLKAIEVYPKSKRSISEYNWFVFGTVSDVLRSLRAEGDADNFNRYFGEFIERYSALEGIEFVCMLEKSYFLKEEKRYEEAKLLLLDLLKKDKVPLSHKVEVFRELMMLQLLLKDYDDALLTGKDMMEDYADQDHLIPNIIEQMLAIYYDKGAYKEAEIFIKENLSKYKGNNDISVTLKKNLARLYMQTERMDKAMKVFNDILKNNVSSPAERNRIKAEIAGVLSGKGEFLRARSIYIEIMEYSAANIQMTQDTFVFWLIREIVNTYRNADDSGDVFSFLNKAKDLFKDNENIVRMLLFEKAFLLDDFGRDKDAAKLYQELVSKYESDENIIEVYRRLAFIFKEQEDFLNAAKYLEKAFFKDVVNIDHNMWILDEVFSAYFNLNMYDAVETFKNKVDDKYGRRKAVANKLKLIEGSIYLARNEFDKALLYYTDLKNTTTSVDVRRMAEEKTAFINEKTGRYDEALDVYKKLLASPDTEDTTKPFYMDEIIRIYNHRMQRPKLLKFLEGASDDYKDNAQVYYRMNIEIVRISKDIFTERDLIVLLNDLLATCTQEYQFKEVYMELADVSQRQGDYKSAIDFYEKILFYEGASPNEIRVNAWLIKAVADCYKAQKTDYQDDVNSFLKKCIDKNGNIKEIEIAVAVERSKLLRMQGNYEDAVKSLKNIIESSKGKPLIIDALLELGFLFLTRKDYISAGDAYQELFGIVAVNSHYEWVIDTVVNSYDEAGSPISAKHDFILKMYNLFGKSEKFEKVFLLYLARLKNETGEFEKAAKYYEAYCEKFSDLARNNNVTFEYASAMQAAMKYEQARILYLQVIADSVTDQIKINALRAIVNLFKDEGKLKELNDFLAEYISKGNDVFAPVLFYELALVKKQEFLWEETEAAVKKALSYAEHEFFIIETYYEMADVYRRNNMYREAEESYRKYIEAVGEKGDTSYVQNTIKVMYTEAALFFETQNNQKQAAYYKELMGTETKQA